MDVVRFDEVSCRFRRAGEELVALDGVSLTVAAGEMVAVMGATGSGKSTLLNCAAGLLRPSAGRVQLLGADLGSLGERSLSRLRRDGVGFVFQSYNLLSELTVAQNVLLPCRLGGPQRRSLDDVLDVVGLCGMARRPVATLSGGQRQRVAVARALITEPQVVFADEPTGALDAATGAAVLDLLRALADRGATVVLVTHDPVAASVTDRLVLLRDGRVVDDRPTPDLNGIAARLAAVSDRRLIGAGR